MVSEEFLDFLRGLLKKTLSSLSRAKNHGFKTIVANPDSFIGYFKKWGWTKWMRTEPLKVYEKEKESIGDLLFRGTNQLLIRHRDLEAETDFRRICEMATKRSMAPAVRHSTFRRLALIYRRKAREHPGSAYETALELFLDLFMAASEEAYLFDRAVVQAIRRGDLPQAEEPKPI